MISLRTVLIFKNKRGLTNHYRCIIMMEQQLSLVWLYILIDMKKVGRVIFVFDGL